MLVPPGVEFLALGFAVMGRGAVPVFVDPGIGRENLMRCITDAAPDALIGTARAQALRLFGKRIFPRLKFHITASEWIYTGGKNLAFLRKFAASPLPEAEAGPEAFIAFTSGATGAPKGVVFTNEMLATQLDIFRRAFGLEEGTRSLPLLPIFSLFDIALGMTSVCAPIDLRAPLSLDPASVVRIIRELEVRASFGSPTLWRKIAEYCLRGGLKLESLRSVLMAGAPVPAETLKQVQSILGSGQAYTPYGATEALPVTAISGAEIVSQTPAAALTGEQGTAVGGAVPGVEIKIIEITDGEIASSDAMHVLPARTIGEVIVRGPNVSNSYVNRLDATRLGKIACAEGGRPWHRMGDLGYVDEQGKLYFCGRKMHRVVHLGRSYYTVPIERLFNGCPAVHRSALVALAPEGRPAVVVEPDPARWPSSPKEEERFRAELRAIAEASPLTRGIADFFFHRSFPVDARHNAKIYRERLGVWASEQMRAQARAA
jgi:acyl-CoA synthetase (AMP-forming)/AMP-acid ligase II